MPSVHTKWRVDAEARRSNDADESGDGENDGRLGDQIDHDGQGEQGHS